MMRKLSRFYLFPSQIVILLLLQKYDSKEGRQADQTLLDDIVPVIRNLQKMNYVQLIYFNHYFRNVLVNSHTMKTFLLFCSKKMGFLFKSIMKNFISNVDSGLKNESENDVAGYRIKKAE